MFYYDSDLFYGSQIISEVTASPNPVKSWLTISKEYFIKKKKKPKTKSVVEILLDNPNRKTTAVV